MQETKLADAAVPMLDFAALGYQVAHHGLGQWNGVAIASSVGLEEITAGLPADDGWTDDGGRFLAATCGGVRVASMYVPNGRVVGTEFYDQKLEWLDRLRQLARDSGRPVSPRSRSAGITTWHLTTPTSGIPRRSMAPPTSPRRSARRCPAAGLGSGGRRAPLPSGAGFYTWWDYRAGNFHKNFGMRIDHVYVTEPLAVRAVAAERDRGSAQALHLPGNPLGPRPVDRGLHGLGAPAPRARDGAIGGCSARR